MTAYILQMRVNARQNCVLGLVAFQIER